MTGIELSYRKIRSVYPVSPNQAYSPKRTFTGNNAVKEIPARGLVEGRNASRDLQRNLCYPDRPLNHFTTSWQNRIKKGR